MSLSDHNDHTRSDGMPWSAYPRIGPLLFWVEEEEEKIIYHE